MVHAAPPVPPFRPALREGRGGEGEDEDEARPPEVWCVLEVGLEPPGVDIDEEEGME